MEFPQKVNWTDHPQICGIISKRQNFKVIGGSTRRFTNRKIPQNSTVTSYQEKLIWLCDLFGSGSERWNESAKNVEMGVPKYSPRGPKTRAPKIRKCRKIITLFIRHDATITTGCTYKVISCRFEPSSARSKATALPIELSSIDKCLF